MGRSAATSGDVAREDDIGIVGLPHAGEGLAGPGGRERGMDCVRVEEGGRKLAGLGCC